jgi:hypothetical protein
MAMTLSVSRVIAKPTAGGGLALDLSIKTEAGETSVVSLTLTSRATEEIRALLRDILPRS